MVSSRICGILSLISLPAAIATAGIINDTNDEILGDNAVIDSTLDSVKDAAESAEGESWWDKVVNFFQGLFGGDDSEETSTEENSETSDTGDEATSPDSESSDDASAEENTLDDGSSDSGSSSEESSEDGGSASDSSQTEDSGVQTESSENTVNE